MKLEFTAFCFAFLLVADFLVAQGTVPHPIHLELVSRRVCIDPCATKVCFGKVNLDISPLTRKGEFYVGDYRTTVVPYFFKNENGTMELEASDDTVRKLMKGIRIKFIGKGTNIKTGKAKVIIGTATPSNGNRGSVTFSIATENGLMVFNTFYHFGE